MKALITGITGQDGSYLAELLLANVPEAQCFIEEPYRPGFDLATI